MNDLWAIACGSGLQDGLNPCIFMASTVVIGLEFLLSLNPLQIIWLRSIFGLAYLINSLNSNFGPAQTLVLRNDFILAAKFIYFVLGFGAFVLGILFFRDWFLLRQGQTAQDSNDKKLKPSAMAVCLTTLFLAILLSSFATLWPINNYISLLGSAGIAKGQWQMVMPYLAVYAFMSMWPLWFIWVVLGIKNLRPSFLKIFCSAISFTASSCMILIFK